MDVRHVVRAVDADHVVGGDVDVLGLRRHQDNHVSQHEDASHLYFCAKLLNNVPVNAAPHLAMWVPQPTDRVEAAGVKILDARHKNWHSDAGTWRGISLDESHVVLGNETIWIIPSHTEII